MQVVCAWCGKGLGTKDGKGNTGTTHGICKVCATKMEKEHEEAQHNKAPQEK